MNTQTAVRVTLFAFQQNVFPGRRSSRSGAGAASWTRKGRRRKCWRNTDYGRGPFRTERSQYLRLGCAARIVPAAKKDNRVARWGKFKRPCRGSIRPVAFSQARQDFGTWVQSLYNRYISANETYVAMVMMMHNYPPVCQRRRSLLNLFITRRNNVRD